MRTIGFSRLTIVIGLLSLGASLLFNAQLASAQPARSYRDAERPWLAEGDSLTANGELELAAESYHRTTDAHADDALVWLRLAAVNTVLERFDAALEAAGRARDLAPDDADPYLMLAQAQAASGDARNALATLEEGVSRHAEDIPLLEALATVKITLREWGPAAGLLRQLIGLRPGQASYHMDLGRILHEVGELDQARSTLREALRLGAPRAVTLAILGHVELSSGAIDSARVHLEQSIAVAPTPEAYAGLGGIHFIRRQPERAEQNFRRSIELSAHDPDVFFNLGNTLVLLDRPEEAIEAYENGIAVDPGRGSAATRLNLAVILLSGMRVAEAQTLLEQARALDPRLPGPHLHLARIARAGYRYEEARKNYLRYRDLVDDEREQRTIANVLADIDLAVAERDAARARGEVHLLQLIVKERAKADVLVQRIRDGEDFFVVAEESSPMARMAGVDVGFVAPSSLHERFHAAVQTLDIGQMTEVLEGPTAFFVFQRVE